MKQNSKIQRNCNGLWRGRIPVPIFMSCKNIHFGLGVLAGLIKSSTILFGFIFYQITEPFVIGVVDNWNKDIVQFLVGFALGSQLNILSKKVSTHIVKFWEYFV